MPEVPFEMSRADLEALIEKYRELKHDINNSLAVIMALSELAQRNPAHYEKLAKTVLARAPGVVQLLQDFQGQLAARLKGGEVPPSGPASGVF
jgi:hypothetical protein